MTGPEHDHVTLLRMEKATWLRLLVAETRTDHNAIAAQGHLVALMDVCAEPDVDWCACPEHAGAVEEIQTMLWRTPAT